MGSKVSNYTSKVQYTQSDYTHHSSKSKKSKSASKSFSSSSIALSVNNTKEPYRLKIEEKNKVITAVCTTKLHKRIEFKVVEEKGKQKVEAKNMASDTKKYKNIKKFTLNELEKIKNLVKSSKLFSK
jgi:hypothetical protein